MAQSSNAGELQALLVALVLVILSVLLPGYWSVLASGGLFALFAWYVFQVRRAHAWLESGAPIKSAPNLFAAPDQIVSNVCDFKRESRQQQERLEELLRRFDAATDAMPDAALVVNELDTIEWANRASEPLLGIDRERDIGQRIDNIVRNPEVREYLTSGNYTSPLEFATQGGEENNLSLRVIPYGDQKRLLSVHDHRDLMRLQQVRRAFISNASHEMRTPLTVIIGYLETLSLQSDLDPITEKGISGALEQAQRLHQLVEDLLSLARLESSPRAASEVEIVNIEEVVREGVSYVGASPAFNRHEIEIEMLTPVGISGNIRELRSAIHNVIDNAVKHTPAGSEIRIVWERNIEGGATLSITDQGEGIPSSHLARLTERFYRVDSGRSRDAGGTGLGLSIVKHVMERHDGRLEIQSELGEGSIFSLIFPKVRAILSN